MKGRITYIIINIDPFAARKGNLESRKEKENDKRIMIIITITTILITFLN